MLYTKNQKKIDHFEKFVEIFHKTPKNRPTAHFFLDQWKALGVHYNFDFLVSLLRAQQVLIKCPAHLGISNKN